MSDGARTAAFRRVEFSDADIARSTAFVQYRMQRDRWKSNSAEAYRDPGVRVRKRLVTAAAKLRKLADTDLALEGR